ncbi:MAG: DUF3307 domain-containing protein [Deltaproteobacteria bacterium]|nr:DUF3307 domain-containing protein [Deltaproteobacteria bacterium]
MSTNEALLLYLSAHLIGDFSAQSESLAELKGRSFKGVLTHALLYGLVFLLTAAIAQPNLYGMLVIIMGHALIDGLKYVYLHRDDPKKKEDKRVVKAEPAWLFIGDQCLHLLTILMASIFYPSPGLASWFPVSGFEVLRWVLLGLLIGKPANISFKVIYRQYANYRGKAATVEGAGATIGFFERLFTVIFVYLGQFTALGFILAAKSLARFKLLSEDQSFSEYYLIGTLYSILFAVIAYFAVFEWLG